MDLNKLLQDLNLNVEKEKLERVIASIEELQRAASGDIPPVPDSGKRRGRRSMSPEEKQEVSARMKKYWASRLKPGQTTRPATRHVSPSPSFPPEPDSSASTP
jgi:hypothetical protein